MRPPPSFLELPSRAAKPRTAGITHVIDKGMPVAELRSLLSSAAELIDIWKVGWGSAYIEPHVAGKVSVLREAGVEACVGGTLLEVAWSQGKAGACLGWAAEMGFSYVEVSNGAAGMPLPEKRRLIDEAARRFVVVAEVGSKQPASPVSAERWAEEMVGDLQAGASWVVAEGRESGTVGLYTPQGRVREELVEAVQSAVGSHSIVYEAPRKDQQTWFIRRFGPNVNLGNIAPIEAMGVEALRLGLRADTMRTVEPARGNAPQ